MNVSVAFSSVQQNCLVRNTRAHTRPVLCSAEVCKILATSSHKISERQQRMVLNE